MALNRAIRRHYGMPDQETLFTTLLLLVGPPPPEGKPVYDAAHMAHRVTFDLGGGKFEQVMVSAAHLDRRMDWDMRFRDWCDTVHKALDELRYSKRSIGRFQIQFEVFNQFLKWAQQ